PAHRTQGRPDRHRRGRPPSGPTARRGGRTRRPGCDRVARNGRRRPGRSMIFQENRPMPRKLLSVICAALALLTATPGAAQVMHAEGATNRTIYVAKDKSLSFRLNRPAGKIVVAQPDTAEIVATTDRSF